MIHFLHTYVPQAILLKLGSIEIHWYGFLIACGAILALAVVLYLAQKYGLKKEDIYNLAFYLVIFGLIGDRLYYVIYAWPYYSHNLLDIFKIWEGGLAIHGAMIAGLIVVLIFGRRHKISPWLLLDIIVVGLALAMAIGRWGNYFNQELFGWPTSLAWGIPISPDKRPSEFASNLYFHPAFLYESLWDLITFLSLFIWHKLRLARLKIKNNPLVNPGWGNIALTYFILYSLGRFSNEFIRIDYSPYVYGIRWAQIFSLFVILVCLGLIIYKLVRKFKQTKQLG